MNLDFADDIVLLENSIAIANEQLNILKTEARKVGLEINEEKTEVMIFNLNTTEQVYLDGKPLKLVKNFKYLGSQMESSKVDFEHRRGLALGAFACMNKIWTSKSIPLSLNVNIFQASVLSILLYGCESWVIDPKMETEINAFANECYRTFLGIKRRDHVTIQSILSKVKMTPLTNIIRQRQLGWLGHTLRSADDEPGKIFALYEPKHGCYKRGPHPLNYKKQISSLLSDDPDCLSIQHIGEMAKDKKKWAKVVAAFGRL